MKRDMDVIRKLVLFLEDADRGEQLWDVDQLGLDQDVIDYHVALLVEAGLIEVRSIRAGDVFKRLTWAGHDFADACRADPLWKNVMRKVAATTRTTTFDVLLHVLKQAATKELVE